MGPVDLKLPESEARQVEHLSDAQIIAALRSARSEMVNNGVYPEIKGLVTEQRRTRLSVVQMRRKGDTV